MLKKPDKPPLRDIFPLCRSALGSKRWSRLFNDKTVNPSLNAFLAALRSSTAGPVPPWLPDLARLEWARRAASRTGAKSGRRITAFTVNPSLQVLKLSWNGLAAFRPSSGNGVMPEPGVEVLLVWRDPGSRRVLTSTAESGDLLALKMIVEGIPAEIVAAEGGLPVGAVDAAVDRAAGKGLLLAPPSRIRRDRTVFVSRRPADRRFLTASSFTLQWHITQACDLHCRHCYDRSDRQPPSSDEAVRVLDDLRTFCRSRNVQGAVSFTGGNPLLHPDFLAIYRAAVERGFSTAILGNPSPRERIEEIIRIRMPAFFQVSLEGLRDHNDSIRGTGHFDRIMDFLGVLRELRVPSMVMLTLTEENRDQVLPLSELLREKTDVFHFNRLALFGKGANLRMADRKNYRAFLENYLRAAKKNPVMGFKDNLINILRREKSRELFGGCTGHGCGAAFNFVTLLADGEVHACRKLPSPLGNIREQCLAEIYDSALAKRYRRGPAACKGCPVRTACGGCLASAKSHGLDIFKDKDPFCFIAR
ncbi:MAG TPA: thio(seleno)oxazole modification radical SAM maturase SbtM [Nitrospirota bacterium]|nr:thio(seleno)oxazole modification radical SAM maturase SbtM [Nitrospirota bacterium]